jgi:hypothetical protein
MPSILILSFCLLTMCKFQRPILINIGDICVSVDSANPDILTQVRDRYRCFLSDKSPDLEIEMAFFEEGTGPAQFLEVPPALLLPEFIERNLALQKLMQPPGSSFSQPAFSSRPPRSGEAAPAPGSDSKPKIAHLDSKILLQRVDFAGVVDTKTRRGKNILGKKLEGFAIESFLRICYSFLAVEQDGLLLHSAGIIRGENGYIFPGHSGTGKSTIASLATSQERVLSDELVVVRKKEKDYLVYSTPFYGTNESTACNSRALLKAAFLPVKDSQVYLKKARPALALTKLMSSVLFFSQEDGLNRRLMDISAGLVAQVPFYEMHFRRDSTFWERIGELERNGGI